MKIKKKVLQKVISVFASVLFLINTFTPYLLITPTLSSVRAQEETVTPTSEPTPTDIVVSTPTAEPTLIPTEIATPTPTVEVTLTSKPIITPTVTPTPVVTSVPNPTKEPSQWTFEKVELNKEYISTQNNKVKLTFTKLPDPAGNIKIEEITLTPEQIKQTGSLSDKAYDITSDMKDGDFNYNLSLPIPESSKDKSVEVKFTEDISSIASAEKVENALTKTESSVSVVSLDHMTIFVVSGASATAATITLVSVLDPSWTAIGGGGVYSAYIGPPAYDYVSPGSTSVYDGRESGIIKAGLTVDPTSGVYKDEGLFGFKPTVTINTLASGTLTYDVENQEGTNPVWMTIEIDTGVVNNRADNTTYQFVSTTNPTGWHTVDAGAGQWQKWNNSNGDTTGNPLITLNAVATANTGKNVVRAYLRLGMGNSYHGTGSGTVAHIDKTTIGGVTYDFVVGAGSTPTSCTGASITPPSGTTACYPTIQEAVDAATSGETINVAPGTYSGNITINKSLTIIGDSGDVSAGPGSNAPIIDGGSNPGSAFFIANGVSDVTIKGFEMQNFTSNDNGVGNGISAWVGSTSNITIQDNYFHNLGYNGVLVGNDKNSDPSKWGDHTNWTIKNNILETFEAYGFELTNTSNSSIENNIIHSNATWNLAATCIMVDARRNASGIVIKDNQIDGEVSAGYPAVYVFADSFETPNVNLNDVIVDGNVISTTSSTSTAQVMAYNYAGTGTVTSVQVYNNTLASLKNRTNAMIDARNNTWSVSDPNNIDQIEAVISQNCTSSPYVHGVCDGGDSTSFGFVRYSNIGEPTNSGWNIRSQSSAPNSTPLDVACGGYTNDNTPSHVWESVAGSNIKYQRQAKAPTGSWWTDTTGYTVTNTPFVWFGNPTTGIEGEWNSQVRAYVDSNNNNIPDVGEETSGWSNECKITYDKTVPTVPINGTPSGTSISTNNFDFNWDDSADNTPITYIFQSTKNPASSGGVLTTGLWTSGTLPASMIHSSVAGDGKWYWQVKAKDAAGNESAWSQIWNVTLDTIAPAVPGNPSPANQSYVKTHDFTFSWDVVSDSSIPVSYEWEFSYGTAVKSDGSFTSRSGFHSLTSASVNSPGTPDNTYYWHVRAIDSLGNASAWSSTWKVIVDTITPIVPNLTWPIGGLATNDNSPLMQWDDSTDTSGIAGYYYRVYYNCSNVNDSSTCSSVYPNTTGLWLVPSQYQAGVTNNGSYYWQVRSKDNAGNLSNWSSLEKVKIDTIAPTVSSVSSDGETYNLASSNPEIKITFSEDISVAPNVEVHTISSGQSINDCSDADAKTYCFTYSLINEELTHTIYISDAKDNAGNLMTLDNSHTFNVDRIVPGISSQTTFSGWYNTNQTSTFTYTDTNGVVSGNNPTCNITAEGTDQTCSVVPNVCDAAGNCNTTPVTSNGADMDFTDPESTITIPSAAVSGSTVYLSDWDGSIAGTATDALSGVNNVKISIQKDSSQYFDGTNFVTTGSEFLLDATYLSGSWNYAGLASPDQGSYTIKSHAIDNATNMESTYTLTIILDKTIPEVAISLNPTVADAQNGWYKIQPEVTLTATDTNIDKIEYQWNSKTGAWTTYSAPFKLGSEGANILYYRAHDKAGNYSDVGIKNIKWDQTELADGPLNMSISPNPTSGTTSVVKWEEADDNTGIDRYEVKWSLKDGNKTYMDAVGNNIREHTIDDLTEGVWNVYVTAFDGSGNSKNASADLTVDQTGPSAPQLSVIGTDVGSVSLSWTKIDEANNYIIWYGRIPGSYQYGAKVGDIQSYTVQGLGAGSYHFIVKSVDSSDNQSGNSNEVSTGAITGALGVAENTPAEGFAENVLGEATESAKLIPTGAVLGTETKTGNNKKLQWWQWVLLSLFAFGGIYFGYKKWKK